jgi:uncharacterized protein (TIGR00251 family)
MSVWYRQEENTIILDVYVQPSAKCTEVVGFHGDSLKIRLASPPIDGRANEALLKYIGKLFDVPTRQVELKRGDKSRHKIIAVVASKMNPLDIPIN